VTWSNGYCRELVAFAGKGRVVFQLFKPLARDDVPTDCLVAPFPHTDLVFHYQ